MHWLAVHLPLPLLPLEVFSPTDLHGPLAVAEGRRLLCCNPQALELGVEPGQSPAAGRALSNELWVLPRDPRAEAEALERLAGWSMQFTSLVSLQPPQGLLLELAGSRRLFGGTRPLARRIAEGMRELGWRLLHDDGLQPTGLRLGLLRPERDTERLLDLLRQRLERLELAAPVIGLELRADHLESFLPAAPDLFGTESEGDEEGQRWLQRLQARLGRERVQGLCLVADHRPELAWSHCPPGTPGSSASHARRPVWLLTPPQPLETRDGRPWYRGSLRLEPERERVESGWWDGREVRRDYFVAHTRQGERLWVYRELQDGGGWFLHGIFGAPG